VSGCFCASRSGSSSNHRRRLTDRARTDLGVLFPEQPTVRAKALLEDVGVKSLWFTTGMKAVKGIGAP